VLAIRAARSIQSGGCVMEIMSLWVVGSGGAVGNSLGTIVGSWLMKSQLLKIPTVLVALLPVPWCN